MRENSRALRLTSELVDLRAVKPNLRCCKATTKAKKPRTSTKKRPPQGRSFLCGRGDKIRTCDFYVPNVALYQAEPHLVMNLFEALRALPVAVPEICCLLFASPNFDRGHSLVLPFSATGSGRTRPQAEPHLAMHTAAKRMPQIAPMHYSKKTRSCQ